MLLLQNDEYAIYNTSQQRMRYLVEFTMDDEVPVDVIPVEKMTADITPTKDDVSVIGKYMPKLFCFRRAVIVMQANT